MLPQLAPSRARKKSPAMPSVWAHPDVTRVKRGFFPLTYVNGPDRPSAILMQGCKQ